MTLQSFHTLTVVDLLPTRSSPFRASRFHRPRKTQTPVSVTSNLSFYCSLLVSNELIRPGVSSPLP